MFILHKRNNADLRDRKRLNRRNTVYSSETTVRAESIDLPKTYLYNGIIINSSHPPNPCYMRKAYGQLWHTG